MRQGIHLFRLFDLDISVNPSMPFALMALWMALTISAFWLGAPLLPSLLGGLIAAVLHWLTELFRQLGHARIVARTGYPMRGFTDGSAILKWWGRR